MTELYDSDNPDDIPSGVWAAGYVDGYAATAWNARGWARFPNAKRIAVFGQTNAGDVLDVERGDATPNEAPAWVLWRRAAGVSMPWIYCNRGNRQLVENALIAGGIPSSEVALWVATLDGTTTVPAGPYPVAAVQYLNSAHSGGHYDRSIVNDLYTGSAGSLGGNDMTPQEHDWLAEIRSTLLDSPSPGKGDWNGWSQSVTASLAAIRGDIAALPAGGATPIDLSAVNAKLDAIKAKLDKDLA